MDMVKELLPMNLERVVEEDKELSILLHQSEMVTWQPLILLKMTMI